MTYDPAFMNTASCRSRDHLHRRRQGHPRVPRLPDRAARRAVDLPRGRLPARQRRAADAGRSSTQWVARDHDPHVRARERQGASCRASATTRTRWGCCSASVGALSTFYPDANDIQDPSNRHIQTIRLIAKMPTLAAFAYRHSHGPAVRLSRTTTSSYAGQLPRDDVQDDRAEVRARSAARARARHPLHPPRRPRAELLDQRGALASAPRRSTRTRRSPPASPRSTARCTAAPTRPCCGCCAGSRRRRTSRTSSRA